MSDDTPDLGDLVSRLAAGDQQALAAAFDRYRARLRRMIQPRLDRRLQGRVDASDVRAAPGRCLSRRTDAACC